ncbi:unnamed protein product [Absidia cylindrospora]
MANLKQPSILCCLLPRSGIMLFTFLSAVYAFSGVFTLTAGYLFVYFFVSLSDSVKDGIPSNLASELFKWYRVIDVFCGLIYVYAFTLAYKMKWKAFEPVLYAFLAIVVYGGYSMYCCIEETYMTAFTIDDSYTERFTVLDDVEKESFKKMLPSIVVAFTFILSVMPWLIQVPWTTAIKVNT